MYRYLRFSADFTEQEPSVPRDNAESPPTVFSLIDTNDENSGQNLQVKSDGQTTAQTDRSELMLTGENKYFEIDLPKEAMFEMCASDWERLKTFQRGHRFQPGQWEDLFVVGMKQSNKYCVFAFRDHYVNKSCVRNRRTCLTKSAESATDSDLRKIFSAKGYCVFEDCSVKFLLKMDDQLRVHVYYEGGLRHSINEVNARYFRGPTRQELKDVLKNTTPMREYLQRVQTMATNGQLEGGNADFVGKSTSVYRRISSEARECYQALLMLRMRLIEKSYSSLSQEMVKIAGIGCWHRRFVKGKLHNFDDLCSFKHSPAHYCWP